MSRFKSDLSGPEPDASAARGRLQALHGILHLAGDLLAQGSLGAFFFLRFCIFAGGRYSRLPFRGRPLDRYRKRAAHDDPIRGQIGKDVQALEKHLGVQAGPDPEILLLGLFHRVPVQLLAAPENRAPVLHGNRPHDVIRLRKKMHACLRTQLLSNSKSSIYDQLIYCFLCFRRQ